MPEEINLLETTDARIWAKEFVRLHGGDEELLVGWFANAMMAENFRLQRNSRAVNIEEAVFQALGEASMCWNPRPTGVFQSDEAKAIGDRLVALLTSIE